MRVTIKDVAKAAGVSPATVSFIINNKPVSISTATREKVLKAIDELHYRPNQLAVSLVTNTSNTIGLILPDSTNPFFASLSHCIEELLRKHNIAVIVGNTNSDPDITRQYLQLFSDKRVDGIILAQLDFEDEQETIACQNIIRHLDIPTVYVDRVANSVGQHSIVEVDQRQIGYLATRHLLNLGHRRIGCASGSIHLTVNQQRYEGYKKALIEYGLTPDPDLLFCDSLSTNCGSNALPCLLGHNVSAIFAFNDMVAYGIYKACRNYNISIPDDISIVGVDDISFSEIINPPLTTIAQPIEKIASHAVEAIKILINGDKPEHNYICLHPLLKVRASTTSYKNL